MKYFTILFLILCSGSFTSGAAQTIEWQIPGKDTVYNTKFKKFKDICVRKMNTEQHAKSRLALMAFSDKLGDEGDPSEIFANESPLPWIKDNIGKTKFSSYEEAEKAWEYVAATSLEDMTHNKEYFDAMMEILTNGDKQIFIDVLDEMVYQYPDMWP